MRSTQIRCLARHQCPQILRGSSQTHEEQPLYVAVKLTRATQGQTHEEQPVCQTHQSNHYRRNSLAQGKFLWYIGTITSHLKTQGKFLWYIGTITSRQAQMSFHVPEKSKDSGTQAIKDHKRTRILDTRTQALLSDFSLISLCFYWVIHRKKATS